MRSHESEKTFSFSFASGDRTYRFDASRTTAELAITEFKNSGGIVSGITLVVPAEALEMFAHSVSEAGEHLRSVSSERPLVSAPEAKAVDPRLAEIKKVHPRAYEKWSSEEDELLRAEFEKGGTVRQLAELFQRQPGAIRSRLQKLGLVTAG